MDKKPLIVRVLLCANWEEGCCLVWGATFAVAAGRMGILGATAQPSFGGTSPWPDRRAGCARMGRMCAEIYDLPEIACAWALLAIDPLDGDVDAKRGYLAPFWAAADAIASDPGLLNDDETARRVLALRMMADFGGPVRDPIAAIVKLSAGLAVGERAVEHLMTWAVQWSTSEGEA
jgi:hypothetical protein